MTITTTHPTSIDIEAMTVEQAKDLRADLDHYIAASTPVGASVLQVFEALAAEFVERFGEQESVENVAKRLGIDLSTATMADVRPLSRYYGSKIGQGADVEIFAGPAQP